MLGEIEGAKCSFIVEHVEILILGVVVDQSCQYLFLIVSIGAEVSIRTLIDSIGIVEAEIFFVFLLVVVLFN